GPDAVEFFAQRGHFGAGVSGIDTGLFGVRFRCDLRLLGILGALVGVVASFTGQFVLGGEFVHAGGGLVQLASGGAFPLLRLGLLLAYCAHVTECGVACLDGGVAGRLRFTAGPFVFGDGRPGFLTYPLGIVGGGARLSLCLVTGGPVIAGLGECPVTGTFGLFGVTSGFLRARVRVRRILLRLLYLGNRPLLRGLQPVCQVAQRFQQRLRGGRETVDHLP